MGLDTVELVLAVEDHFAITIPDDIAQTLFTVGDLHSFVVAELEAQGKARRGHNQIYEELRDLICKHLGVDPRQVQPEARFVQDLHAD